MASPLNYQILITPLESKDVYGSIVDVTKDVNSSEFVEFKGIGKIKEEIDNGNYDFGIFSFDDITIKFLNYDGRFNSEINPPSIFTFRRDLAKIKVNFISSSGNSTISFNGILNDEASRQDFNKGTATLKFLSFSSIFRKTRVSSGIIKNVMSFSLALKLILNNPSLFSLLNFDESKINVNQDGNIDVGNVFSNLSIKDAVNKILIASISILQIDETNTIVVRSRLKNTTPVKIFYGAGDVLGRENIISIKNFNTGLHRTFNKIIINEISFENTLSINAYGLRQKEITLDFITAPKTIENIGLKILEEFAFPRQEFLLSSRSEGLENIKLLDTVKILNLTQLKPAEGEFLPLWGSAIWGQDVYPFGINQIPIHPENIFKVIESVKNPKNFITELKLREVL